MNKILFYLFVLLAAVLAGLAIAAHSSYVFINYGQWSIESPLWLAIVALASLFLIVHYVFRFLLGIENTYDRWIFWRQKQKINTANVLTKKGFFYLIQEHWKESESCFIRATTHSQISVILYLLAAFSADQQGLYHQRDQYVAKARITEPESEIPIELFLANLQLKAHQLNLLRPRLEYLRQLAPKNQFILHLLKNLYEQLEEWSELVELLPQIKKMKLLSSESFCEFELRIYRLALQKETDQGKLAHIRGKIPRRVKKML